MKKELRTLHIVLEDRSARLASEMNSSIRLDEKGREQSKERVSLEQIQFY